MAFFTAPKASRSVGQGLFLALIYDSQAIAGNNVIATDVGAEVVISSDDSSLLDCAPFIYDKRGLLSIRESYAERDATYTGAVVGRARLTDKKDLEPYEASSAVGGEWRYGHQKLKLNLSLNYSSSEAWGCSTTVASRLQRQRDLENKLLVPGDSLHTRNATAAYSYSAPDDTFTLAYTMESRLGDQVDNSSTIDASIAHALEKNLLLQANVGAGMHTADFSPFTSTHAGAGSIYRPSPILSLTLGEQVETRSTKEQRYTSTATMAHQSSRIVSEQLGITVHQAVHSQVPSEKVGNAEVTAAVKHLTYTIGAHRLEIDDSPHSAGNWYTFTTSYALTKAQTLSGQASYGSSQPSLMKMMSAAGISYAALLGTTSARMGHDTPHYAVTASFLVTRLSAINNSVNTVRQAQAGVTATF